MLMGSMISNRTPSSPKGLFISKEKGRRIGAFGLFNHEHPAGDKLYLKCIDLRRHVFIIQRARAFCFTSYPHEAVETGQPDLLSEYSLLPDFNHVRGFQTMRTASSCLPSIAFWFMRFGLLASTETQQMRPARFLSSPGGNLAGFFKNRSSVSEDRDWQSNRRAAQNLAA
jgi:hypothetical protein